MSEPTELYEILERFAPILDDSDLSDLSRMCREYAVNVHESRLSPPLAPVLECPTNHEIFDGEPWARMRYSRPISFCPDCGAILESSSAPTGLTREALKAF